MYVTCCTTRVQASHLAYNYAILSLNVDMPYTYSHDCHKQVYHNILYHTPLIERHFYSQTALINKT